MSDGDPPTRPLSKPVVDPLNTVCWFGMDACWLLGFAGPAYLAAGLTVLSGLVLLALGWRRGWGERLADLGLNGWIAMNTVWCVCDLSGRPVPRPLAGTLAAVGAGCILAAAWHSQDLRRLRITRR